MFPRSTVSSFTRESHTDAQRSFRRTSSCALGGAAWMCVSEFWRSGAAVVAPQLSVALQSCGNISKYSRYKLAYKLFNKKSNTSNQDLGDVSFSLCLRLLLLKYFVSFLPVFLLVCSCTCVCFEATGLSRCFNTCTTALKEHNLRMHLLRLVGTSLNWFITPPAPRYIVSPSFKLLCEQSRLLSAELNKVSRRNLMYK